MLSTLGCLNKLVQLHSALGASKCAIADDHWPSLLLIHVTIRLSDSLDSGKNAVHHWKAWGM